MHMRLSGKRIERKQSALDTSCTLKLKSTDGKMLLSQGARITLDITSENNRVGFAYPDGDDDNIIYIYKSNDGVACNKQGWITNRPHNRDIRLIYDLGTEEITLDVAKKATTFDDYPGMKFFALSAQVEYNDGYTQIEDEETETNDLTQADVDTSMSTSTAFPNHFNL